MSASSMIINYANIYVPGSMIIEQFGLNGLTKVLNKFVIKYMPHIGTVKTLTVYKKYKKDGNIDVFFPKGSYDQLSKVINIKNAKLSYAIPVKINELTNADTMPLYTNQQSVLEYLLDNQFSDKAIIAGRANANLKMPAGSGKTRLGLGLAKALGLKTLVVVPTEYLMLQWKEEYEDMFGDGYTAGLYSGKYKTDGHVVIGIINSLLRVAPEYFDKFGFVIFDESHDYCSETFSEIFWRAQRVCNLSLTATPDERKDGFDRALKMHFGPIIDVKTLPNYKDDSVAFTGSVEAIKYVGPDAFTGIVLNEKMGLISVPHMIAQFIRDPYRNKLIINKAMELYNQNRHIYIFTDQRAHAFALRDMFKVANVLVDIDVNTGDDTGDNANDNIGDNANDNPADDNKDACITEVVDKLDNLNIIQGNDTDNTESIANIEGVNNHVLIGGVKKDVMDDAKEKKERSIIITTYGYSYRGVSIKHMDSLIIATPRASKFTQIIGRIKRKGGDASIPRKVIDIIDSATPLKKQFSERKKAYIREQLDIKTSNVRWNELNLQ